MKLGMIGIEAHAEQRQQDAENIRLSSLNTFCYNMKEEIK